MDKIKTSGKSTLSFGFSKTKKPSKVIPSKFSIEESAEKVEKQLITSLDDGVCQSKKPKPKFVIPMANTRMVADDTQDELTKAAINALLTESKESKLPVVGETIPLLARANRDADGNIQTGIDSDFSIPVEDFGLAMLRGMGYKEEKSVKEDSSSHPEVFIPRPSGMGLGVEQSQWKAAEEKAKRKRQGKDGKPQNLKIEKGVHCIALKGRYQDMYGTIEEVNSEKKECKVKLVESGNTRWLSQNDLRLVTDQDFKHSSRFINNSAYEKHKREIEQKNGKRAKRLEEETENERSGRRGQPSSESTSTTHSKHRSKRPEWVQEGLRVRFIDKHYKDGKHYKTKVDVVEASSRKSITCRTHSGEKLYDLHESMLETVIPKDDDQVVLVVQGPHRGQTAYIRSRNKDECQARVKLVNDSRKIVLDYDSMCEYLQER